MQSRSKKLANEEDVKEFILVILIVGFSINAASSALFNLFEPHTVISGLQIELWIIILAISLIIISGIFYLYSKQHKKLQIDEEKKRKEIIAIEYLTSLIFDYIHRFLLELQTDTKDIPENDVIHKLNEPIAFANSSLTNKRLKEPWDLIFTHNMLEKWDKIVSDEFSIVLKQIIKKIPFEKWIKYGETLDLMMDELLKLIDIIESNVPPEIISMLTNLQIESQSFIRCSQIMPFLYKQRYPESELDEYFLKKSVNCLHTSFKSINLLAGVLWNLSTKSFEYENKSSKKDKLGNISYEESRVL